MENTPTYVQVGPYTYCIVHHSKASIPADSFVDHAAQTISLARTLSPQKEAAGVIRAVFQIIFEMMGNDNDEAHSLSRELGNIFCSTLGDSPEAFAWAMAGLLEDREDRKRNPVEPSYGNSFIDTDMETERFRVPPNVAAYLRRWKLTETEAIEKGLAQIKDGFLCLRIGKGGEKDDG